MSKNPLKPYAEGTLSRWTKYRAKRADELRAHRNTMRADHPGTHPKARNNLARHLCGAVDREVPRITQQHIRPMAISYANAQIDWYHVRGLPCGADDAYMERIQEYNEFGQVLYVMLKLPEMKAR